MWRIQAVSSHPPAYRKSNSENSFEKTGGKIIPETCVRLKRELQDRRDRQLETCF